MKIPTFEQVNEIREREQRDNQQWLGVALRKQHQKDRRALLALVGSVATDAQRRFDRVMDARRDRSTTANHHEGRRKIAERTEDALVLLWDVGRYAPEAEPAGKFQQQKPDPRDQGRLIQEGLEDLLRQVEDIKEIYGKDAEVLKKFGERAATILDNDLTRMGMPVEVKLLLMDVAELRGGCLLSANGPPEGRGSTGESEEKRCS
ncbi:MAG: hypothetical protein KAW17_09525 [Candidatus Eisenbacteria sp.]|nr:hypothetical protein [Candidatus Eisenbacteria bacterium]